MLTIVIVVNFIVHMPKGVRKTLKPDSVRLVKADDKKPVKTSSEVAKIHNKITGNTIVMNRKGAERLALTMSHISIV